MENEKKITLKEKDSVKNKLQSGIYWEITWE